MAHKWAMHWLPYHTEGWEWEHIVRMGYKSIKIFEQHWSNAEFCNRLLNAASPDCIFVLRDWPMSEQKEDMWADPVGTGRRHAADWNNKFSSGQVKLPRERCVVLGINEPDAVNGDRNSIDLYNSYFLNDLSVRGGGLSFGVGHPRTEDGTTQTERDWSVFERTHQAIVRGNHYLVVHEYGAAANHGWGYWMCGFWTCPWPDVRIIIGECGIDENVVDGQGNRGWLVSMPDRYQYTQYLDAYHAALMSDQRIHSAMVFTFDFSHPWDTFNVRDRELCQIWESYQWSQGTAPTIDSPPTKPVQPESDDWIRAIRFVLQQEGVGPSIDSNGAITKYGINQAANPDIDVANLTVDQAIQIYHDRYWVPSGASQLQWPMNLLVFDAAVQHGVGVAKDLASGSHNDPLTYFGNRLRFYAQIKSFPTYGAAWTRRMGDLALEMGRDA